MKIVLNLSLFPSLNLTSELGGVERPPPDPDPNPPPPLACAPAAAPCPSNGFWPRGLAGCALGLKAGGGAQSPLSLLWMCLMKSMTILPFSGSFLMGNVILLQDGFDIFSHKMWLIYFAVNFNI